MSSMAREIQRKHKTPCGPARFALFSNRVICHFMVTARRPITNTITRAMPLLTIKPETLRVQFYFSHNFKIS